MVTLPGMFLRDILPDYGVSSLTELGQRLGLTKQYAWLLWHGKIALSMDMARRMHETFSVPVEVLMQITRATPAKRRGRKPLRPRPKGRAS